MHTHQRLLLAPLDRVHARATARVAEAQRELDEITDLMRSCMAALGAHSYVTSTGVLVTPEARTHATHSEATQDHAPSQAPEDGEPSR